MTESELQELADERGVAREYIDVRNELVTIEPQSRLNALKIMGYDLDNPAELAKVLQAEEARPYSEILDPVTVLRDGEPRFFLLRSRASLSEEAELSLSFELEDGTRLTRQLPLYQAEIAEYHEVEGVEYDVRRVYLEEDLPYGYHSVSAVIRDGYNVFNSIKSSLIITPLKAYMPDDLAQGRRLWGVSVQLYAVRSRRNWGMGDFDDLKSLLHELSRCGGQFVGLNPMHAGYPNNPDPNAVSPYSPSSRRWLNIAYISVPAVPEYNECPEAVDLVNSQAVQQKIKALRDREYVDYRGVIELKLKVLRVIFDKMKVDDRRSTRGKKFLEFIEQGGRSLLDMATFDALQEFFVKQGKAAASWMDFPREYQKASQPFVEVWRKEHSDDVRFYCYLQFLAAEQLQQAYEQAGADGLIVGTYRDLAVGVPSGSCDVWSDEFDVFRAKGEVGAPPDPLGPLGQAWGLSPMDPTALKRCGYKPLIDLYRANMRSCGALRIDHAAGLYRFWWIMLGQPAKTGAYVQTPLHDLLGIIALESWRNRCLIICEDLGTIPMELREALLECGALSYKIFFNERSYDGGFIDPKLYVPVSMAALTTHDMPTIKGWWEDRDLIDGVSLGIYTQEQCDALREERRIAKQRMFDSMHYLGSLDSSFPSDPSQVPFSPQLVRALQVHVCRSSCLLYSSQLEDWIGVEKPVNVPGTMSEYPNWKRKLTMDLEDIFTNDYVKDLTSAMTAARNE
ncbi:MAG: 4-alpha-glucanotransferase [Succinivibrio sp.]|nr:4-alpha-glucanotransferase [Succinivibrio sp.]